MQRLRQLLNWKTRAAQPATLENGTVLIGSEVFRRAGALKQDGRFYLVVEENQGNTDWRKERVALEEAGLLPRMEIQEIAATYDEVAAQYQADGLEDSSGAEKTTTQELRSKVRILLEEAVAWRATDIRIITREYRTDVIFRVMNEDVVKGEWTKDLGGKVIAFLFDVRAEKSGEQSEINGQAQSFGIARDPNKIDFPKALEKIRAESLWPDQGSGKQGRCVIMRLFYAPNAQNGETNSLENLGFGTDVLEKLKRASYATQGLIIVGGRTASGKNTTLMRWLARTYENNHGRKAIMTVEDPVEIILPGKNVIQVPIASGNDDTREQSYADALRSSLRCAPDIVMVSEIRDGQAAKEVIKFVTTGHLACSTVHASHPIAVVQRLINFGIPVHDLAQTGVLRLLLVQSMVQRLCPDCSVPVDRERILERLPMLAALSFTELKQRSTNGCETCNPSGTSVSAGVARQIAVGEAIEPDTHFLDLIAANDLRGAEKYWLRPSNHELGGLDGRDIKAKIIDLMLDGHVDPDHAIAKDVADFIPDYRPRAAKEKILEVVK